MSRTSLDIRPAHGLWYLLLTFLLQSLPLQAQPQLSTLSEIQLGNLPDSTPTNLRTLYHQFNFGYMHDDVRIGLRAEAFGSSASGRSYGEVLQRFASYRRGALQATLGHFYTIVGSGLLAHAFELPGVITEERSSRRRYQLVNDLDGIHVRYSQPWGNLQLLRGTPVNSDLPPGLQDTARRQGTIQGGTLMLRPRSYLDTELGLLHYDVGGQREVGASLSARLRLTTLLASLGLTDVVADAFGEYAQREPSASRFLSLDRDLSRALYLSTTVTAGAWGFSLEFKDYRDFALIQINNPPPLIREHAAHLLNRITHDVLADDERGIQGEVSYTSSGGYVQLFVDFNRNQILDDQRHRVVGSLWTWAASPHYTLELDAQFQDVDRRFGQAKYPYTNFYVQLAFQRASGLSAALQLERSTDILATGADPSGTTWWHGLHLDADLGSAHQLSLFAGQRRSGLACTSGTCYEILGFEGVELRLHNRFF